MLNTLTQLIDAFTAGDVARCAALTSTTWPAPADRPTEASPQEHWATLGAELRAALDDWEIQLDGAKEEEGQLTAQLSVAVTFAKDLWDFPANGKRISMTAKIVAEADGERLRWWLEDWVAILALRDLGIVPQPEFMDRPLAYPIQMPDAVLKFAFNGGFLEKPCSHLHDIEVTDTDDRRCKACDAEGTEYPAARLCMTCGHVGCCDAAKNKHAKKHYEETGHPLVRSLRLQETWMWCYDDGTVMSKKW